MKKTNEPPKQQGKKAPDTSNIMTRSAKRGSALEQFLTNKYDKDENTPSYGSDAMQRREEKTMTKTEAVAFIQRVAGVDKATAEEMNDAVWEWTNGAYDGIRSSQQGKIDNDYYKKLGDNLEKYISRAAKWGGGVTYRGIDTTDPFYSPGDKINMRGTSSWSTRESVAQSFSFHNGVVFVSPTQRKGTSTNFSHQHNHEHEVTVSKNAEYVVKRKEKKNGMTYYYLEEA